MPSNAASNHDLWKKSIVETLEKEVNIKTVNTNYKTLVWKMGYGVNAYFSF